MSSDGHFDGSTSDDNKTCRICLEPIAIKEKATIDCGHEFHLNCIEMWTSTRNTCAYCKRPTRAIHHDFDVVTGQSQSTTPLRMTPREALEQFTYETIEMTREVANNVLISVTDGLASTTWEVVNNSTMDIDFAGVEKVIIPPGHRRTLDYHNHEFLATVTIEGHNYNIITTVDAIGTELDARRAIRSELTLSYFEQFRNLTNM